MASSGGGKKSKKNKKNWKPVAVDEIFQNTVVRSTSWADEVENELNENINIIPLNLPTAPRAACDIVIDESKIPADGPFVAYMSNLPYEISEDEILQQFTDSRIKIEKVELPKDVRQDRMRGFGYLELTDKASLINILSEREVTIKGRMVRISLPDDSRDNRSSGFNRQQQQGSGGIFGRRSDQVDGGPDRTSGNWRSTAAPAVEPPTGGFGRQSGRRDFGSRDFSRDGGGRFGRDSDRQEGGTFTRNFNREDRQEGSAFTRNFNRDGDRQEGSAFNRGFNRDGDRQEGSAFSRGFNRDGDQRSRPFQRFDRDESTPFRRSGFGSSNREFGSREENLDKPSELKERPRIQLKPREVKEDTAQPAPSLPSSIFGGAKPVDTSKKEREIEERLSREAAALATLPRSSVGPSFSRSSHSRSSSVGSLHSSSSRGGLGSVQDVTNEDTYSSSKAGVEQNKYCPPFMRKTDSVTESTSKADLPVNDESMSLVSSEEGRKLVEGTSQQPASAEEEEQPTSEFKQPPVPSQYSKPCPSRSLESSSEQQFQFSSLKDQYQMDRPSEQSSWKQRSTDQHPEQWKPRNRDERFEQANVWNKSSTASTRPRTDESHEQPNVWNKSSTASTRPHTDESHEQTKVWNKSSTASTQPRTDESHEQTMVWNKLPPVSARSQPIEKSEPETEFSASAAASSQSYDCQPQQRQQNLYPEKPQGSNIQNESAYNDTAASAASDRPKPQGAWKTIPPPPVVDNSQRGVKDAWAKLPPLSSTAPQNVQQKQQNTHSQSSMDHSVPSTLEEQKVCEKEPAEKLLAKVEDKESERRNAPLEQYTDIRTVKAHPTDSVPVEKSEYIPKPLQKDSAALPSEDESTTAVSEPEKMTLTDRTHKQQRKPAEEEETGSKAPSTSSQCVAPSQSKNFWVQRAAARDALKNPDEKNATNPVEHVVEQKPAEEIPTSSKVVESQTSDESNKPAEQAPTAERNDPESEWRDEPQQVQGKKHEGDFITYNKETLHRGGGRGGTRYRGRDYEDYKRRASFQNRDWNSDRSSNRGNDGRPYRGQDRYGNRNDHRNYRGGNRGEYNNANRDRRERGFRNEEDGKGYEQNRDRPERSYYNTEDRSDRRSDRYSRGGRPWDRRPQESRVNDTDAEKRDEQSYEGRPPRNDQYYGQRRGRGGPYRGSRGGYGRRNRDGYDEMPSLDSASQDAEKKENTQEESSTNSNFSHPSQDSKSAGQSQDCEADKRGDNTNDEQSASAACNSDNDGMIQIRSKKRDKKKKKAEGKDTENTDPSEKLEHGEEEFTKISGRKAKKHPEEPKGVDESLNNDKGAAKSKSKPNNGEKEKSKKGGRQENVQTTKNKSENRFGPLDNVRLD